MSDRSLHQFYLGLVPNLLMELLFFIPEKEIRKDIVEKLDFLKAHGVLNKIYVIDYYKGPMEYKKGRNNKYILLKGSYLEKNIFSLLEKKSKTTEHGFNYVLNSYFEMVECLFYITNWMDSNIEQVVVNKEEGAIGLFHLQFLDYKRHFEALVKNFYPNQESIPKGKFNAIALLQTHYPKISKGFENAAIKPDPNATQTKRHHTTPSKKRLVTEDDAKQLLLKTFFNITVNP